jgi:hypothetical protein
MAHRHGRRVAVDEALRVGCNRIRMNNSRLDSAEPVVEASLTDDWLPVVEEYLEWFPHRDPSTDHQAFAK